MSHSYSDYLLMKKKIVYLIVIFLIVSACVAFGRIAYNGFINFDDKEYVTENRYIQSGINCESIKWAATAVVVNCWLPLTLISHMLDWYLFGTNAGGHHIVSLFLHISTVIFLFLFLNKTTKNIWSSAFAAALFSLHPLRVESVAWVAERKDVLSMFFGIASLYVYSFYVEDNKLPKYFLCLILFAMALMSKPMLITLPFVMLLLDFWPLTRWQKAFYFPINRFSSACMLVWEKVPFMFLTVISCVLTLWAQSKDGAVISTEHLFSSMRINNAVVSYVSYLRKTFLPVDLAVFYPYEYPLPLWQSLISWFILIAVTVVVIYTIKKFPFLFVGWFWYLGTLIPVIGFLQVGKQAMADRYTYLPSIGIAIMLAWFIPILFQRKNIQKKILFPVAIICLVIMTALTWQQSGYWKNSIILWSHTLQVTKSNYDTNKYLASAMAEEGKIKEAIFHYNKAIQLKPDFADAYFSKGNAYIKLREYQLAVDNFNKAISLNAGLYDAYNNRAFIRLIWGQYQQALDDYNKAILIKPGYADARNNRAFVYLTIGNINSGCSDAQKACEEGVCGTLEFAKKQGYCY